MDAKPDVFAHNLETVRRLTPLGSRQARGIRPVAAGPRARQERAPHRYTKTSLMLGLGETDAEIETAMDDARAVGVDIFTMGQYLQPSKKHLPVLEFVTPEKFEQLGAPRRNGRVFIRSFRARSRAARITPSSLLKNSPGGRNRGYPPQVGTR